MGYEGYPSGVIDEPSPPSPNHPCTGGIRQRVEKNLLVLEGLGLQQSRQTLSAAPYRNVEDPLRRNKGGFLSRPSVPFVCPPREPFVYVWLSGW